LKICQKWKNAGTSLTGLTTRVYSYNCHLF
jgi:hypothetical protein